MAQSPASGRCCQDPILQTRKRGPPHSVGPTAKPELPGASKSPVTRRPPSRDGQLGGHHCFLWSHHREPRRAKPTECGLVAVPLNPDYGPVLSTLSQPGGLGRWQGHFLLPEALSVLPSPSHVAVRGTDMGHFWAGAFKSWCTGPQPSPSLLHNPGATCGSLENQNQSGAGCKCLHGGQLPRGHPAHISTNGELALVRLHTKDAG